MKINLYLRKPIRQLQILTPKEIIRVLQGWLVLLRVGLWVDEFVIVIKTIKKNKT